MSGHGKIVSHVALVEGMRRLGVLSWRENGAGGAEKSHMHENVEKRKSSAVMAKLKNLCTLGKLGKDSSIRRSIMGHLSVHPLRVGRPL